MLFASFITLIKNDFHFEEWLMPEMSAFKLFMVATQLIILSYPVMLLTSFTILSYAFFL